MTSYFKIENNNTIKTASLKSSDISLTIDDVKKYLPNILKKYEVVFERLRTDDNS